MITKYVLKDIKSYSIFICNNDKILDMNLKMISKYILIQLQIIYLQIQSYLEGIDNADETRCIYVAIYKTS